MKYNIKTIYYIFYHKYFEWMQILDTSKSFSEWKAITFVSLVQALFIGSCYLQYVIITRNPFTNDKIAKIVVGIVCLCIGVTNHIILGDRHKWKLYREAIQKFNKKQNLISSLIVIGVTLGIISFMSLSFYQLSKIDWNYETHNLKK